MKVLIATSTLPATDEDKVPAFVKDQAIHMIKRHPNTKIIIHAPHNHYSQTHTLKSKHKPYKEVRFHYFWPYRLELLAGRGIMPALKANKFLYIQIPFLFIFQFFSLWNLTRKEKPELLYAHWFTPQAINTALVSKLTGIPFVFTTHASDVSVLKKLPFASRLVRWVCKRARAYTAVSERTANKLRGFFTTEEWKEYSKKLSIIPMGVDISLPKLSKQELKDVRKKYSLDERPIVLFLGRLAEKKGVTYLLNAWATLPEKLRSNHQLVIAGDGQLRQVLEKEAKELNLNNVVFAGYIYGKEKDGLFALADFLCLPSIIDSSGDSEGFPVVLMEGLAAGKIVLASDATGGEAILTHRKDGFIFTQKSVNSLTKILKDAITLTKTEKAVIQQGSTKLATQFDWDKIDLKHYIILKKAAYENTHH